MSKGQRVQEALFFDALCCDRDFWIDFYFGDLQKSGDFKRCCKKEWASRVYVPNQADRGVTPLFPLFQMMSSERQTCGWRRQLLIVLVKLCLAFAGPLRPLNGTECTAKSPASYILVFTGHWSPQSFPKQYPLFRPPAQWSKLIGEKVHRGQRENVHRTANST